MRWNRILCAGALALAVVGYAADTAHPDEPRTTPQQGVVKLGNATCPIKGTPVDGTTTTVWEGLEIGFSGSEARSAFIGEPGKYTAALLRGLASQLADVRARLEKYEPPPKPTPAATPKAALTPAIDATVLAYLDVAKALAADDDAGAASAALVFQETAKALDAAAKDTNRALLSTTVREKAAAIVTGTIATRRKAFPALGAAVIALVDAESPSSALGESLFVVHCAMFAGDWLQRDEVVSNPFYGQAMANCGSVTRKIRLGTAK